MLKREKLYSLLQPFKQLKRSKFYDLKYEIFLYKPCGLLRPGD